jgi:uncharacterized membrane protein YdcZ (DUF606 family)
MKHLMLVVALVLALGIAVRAQADIVTTLGSSVEEAHDAIFSAFSTGSISMVGVSDVFKTAGARLHRHRRLCEAMGGLS